MSEKLDILKGRDVNQTSVGLTVRQQNGRPVIRQSVHNYKEFGNAPEEWVRRFCTTYGFEFPAHLYIGDGQAELTPQWSEVVQRLVDTQNAMAAQLTRMEADLRTVKEEVQAYQEALPMELLTRFVEEMLRKREQEEATQGKVGR